MFFWPDLKLEISQEFFSQLQKQQLTISAYTNLIHMVLKKSTQIVLNVDCSLLFWPPICNINMVGSYAAEDELETFDRLFNEIFNAVYVSVVSMLVILVVVSLIDLDYWPKILKTLLLLLS